MTFSGDIIIKDINKELSNITMDSSFYFCIVKPSLILTMHRIREKWANKKVNKRVDILKNI
jgi:hypothetical protein